MSTTSYFIKDHLDSRSQYAKPGVKKLVKSLLSRVARKSAKLNLVGEIQTLVSSKSPFGVQNLRELTAAELDDYADFLLQGSPTDDGLDGDGSSDLDVTSEFFADEPNGVSSPLLGSLPDWLIAQIQDANGSAFAMLSLFEAKSPSPKAAISMEDEVMYA